MMRIALEQTFEPTRRRIGDRWLLLLALCLAGYALAGRGFAYLGLPPIFIGEICLAAGVCVFLTIRGWTRVLQVGASVMVLPLAGWGFIRMVPYLGEYKIDAIRDAVVW